VRILVANTFFDIYNKNENTYRLLMYANFRPKVGDCMDIRTTVKDIVESKGGIAKSADFVAAGIRAVDVVNLCNAGYLDRVRHSINVRTFVLRIIA